MAETAERCYNITQAYLSLPGHTSIIEETQDAIRLTKTYLLADIFQRWNPFGGEIAFSYNGGKDCQVLLMLYLGCLWEFFLESIADSQYPFRYQKFPLKRLPTVYINQVETFETLDKFIKNTTARYCLSLYESPRNQTSMQRAFQSYLDLRQETQAIVIGIRHTDPFGSELKCIEETDSDWPRFMRLQPILHWRLSDIWSMLLYSGEEICGLYGLGFTSIGSVNGTVRNPYLRNSSEVEPALRNRNDVSFEAAATTTTTTTTTNGEPAVDVKNHFLWEIEHAYGKQTVDEHVNVSAISESDARLIFAQDSNSFYPGWYLINDSWERAGRISKK